MRPVIFSALKWLTLSLALLVFTSCEELLLPDDSTATPMEIFDEAWTFADREYAFFDFKKIDWDSVRNVYEPRISENMSDEELFDVLADMLYVLRDGHVNLVSDFDISRNDTWYLNSPPNFSRDVLERGYFKEKQQFVGSFVVYDFGDVGYIRYESFVNPIAEEDLNYVLTKFADRKGIIVDVRNNGGGSLLNAINFARRFTTSEVTVGSWRFKNGPGHNDFTELSDIQLSPATKPLFGDAETPVTYTKPVVVLTNRSSYSAANFFPLYMKALPNVTLVGDTTGGGGGAPANTELANGWNIRVSSSQLFDPTGFNVEDGIPPDERVDLDPQQALNLVDTMLEKALELLRR